jgi:hypothetical protein
MPFIGPEEDGTFNRNICCKMNPAITSFVCELRPALGQEEIKLAGSRPLDRVDASITRASPEAFIDAQHCLSMRQDHAPFGSKRRCGVLSLMDATAGLAGGDGMREATATDFGLTGTASS